ncbi:MAG TPA: RsmD family RNA methyltransferase, partial [Caulobacter sp.]|nr:RsmD family RNA methyltransferase [Caulobacter sp.]
MRIVSGSLRGRALKTPEGQGTRPTSDRARQAVFNILEHAAWAPELRGARIIDL